MKNINDIKSIALPREHGSWGFVLEPLVLSLLIAFSFDGLYLAISAFFIFLAHQPLRVFIRVKDIRLNAALIFVLFFFMGVVFFCLSFWNAQVHDFYPFFSALLLMLAYLLYEIQSLSRKTSVEIIAPVSLALIALSTLLIAGWDLAIALPVFFLILSRSIPTIFFIRARLRLDKQMPVLKWPVLLLHGVVLLFSFLLFFLQWAPFAAVLAVFMLNIRTFMGLSEKRKLMSVQKIGILEFVYGALFVLIVAAGYKLL